MNHRQRFSTVALCLSSVFPAFGQADSASPQAYDGRPGVSDPNSQTDILLTLSNDAASNEVFAYRRLKDGSLQTVGHFATGGLGTGDGLGNQGPLALSENGRYLFAVNPGSDDVSVFRLKPSGLELVDRAKGNGARPVSVTANRNRVYVVNAGDDSIFGFQFDPSLGKLLPMANSRQLLSGTGTGAAQISFNQDGDALAITEKATNKITTFTLNDDGTPGTRHVIDSAGKTPFGFAFGKRNQFFVSEAQAAAAGAATVSSYQLWGDGTVEPIDGALAVGQTAACWLATTPDGHLAFTADTPANAISVFAIDYAGHLSLLQTKAAEENKPIDLAVSAGGRLLYSLNSGDHSISVYQASAAGKLKKLNAATAIPDHATGLVATVGMDAKKCLLDWAEENYPSLFFPAGAISQDASPYTYRYYGHTHAYVGISSANNHVYYRGPDDVLQDVGDLSAWLAKANCQ